MGVLTIKEGDVVQKLYAKKRDPNPGFPPYDDSVTIAYFCKSIDMVAGTVVVDRYRILDKDGNILDQKPILGSDETIELAEINDDTKYNVLATVQLFHLYAKLNRATKTWSIVPKLYFSLAAAKTGEGTTDLAELGMTQNAGFYIRDATLVPIAKS